MERALAIDPCFEARELRILFTLAHGMLGSHPGVLGKVTQSKAKPPQGQKFQMNLTEASHTAHRRARGAPDGFTMAAQTTCVQP